MKQHLYVHFIARLKISIFFLLAVYLSSAQAITTDSVSTIKVDNSLQQILQARSVKAAGIDLPSQDTVHAFYQNRDYQFAWINPDYSINLQVASLLGSIADAEQEGLSPLTYHQQQILPLLLQLGSILQPDKQLLIDLELLLTDAFITYASHRIYGQLDAKSQHKTWTLEKPAIDVAGLLQQALVNENVHQVLADLTPAHSGYQQLKLALADYRKIAERGGWPFIEPDKKLEKGVIDTRVKQLRERLRLSGDYDNAIPKSSELAFLFDDSLHQAVIRFQARHGLLQDGIVGRRTIAALNVSVEARIAQLELNLERWRWLPDHLGERYILVNIPAYEMNLYEHNKPVFHSKVIVGKKKRSTPIFSGEISHLVMSPYWNVPYKIAVKDKLPMLRRNPHKLKRAGLRAFSRSGRELSVTGINWHSVSSRNFGYRLRQDPGPKNALGKVKFMFPNAHSVYLHDTSAPKLFAKTRRSFSSGCVRVEKPIALAEALLKFDKQWDRKNIVKATSRKRPKTVKLQKKVPVHLMYWTAWQDANGIVHFRDDIYKQDKPLQQALNKLEVRLAAR